MVKMNVKMMKTIAETRRQQRRAVLNVSRVAM